MEVNQTQLPIYVLCTLGNPLHCNNNHAYGSFDENIIIMENPYSSNDNILLAWVTVLWKPAMFIDRYVPPALK